jgi:lipopolysaccharide transport system permease protein
MHRELFFFFTWRDIKIKYKQTLLGFAWAVLQPLLMMLIFTYFFGNMVKPRVQGVSYPVFVYSGLLLWNVFSSGITNASSSMVTNSHIIKKIYFPRLIIPLSSILVSLFDFLMALVVYAGMLVWYGQHINPLRLALLLPPGIVLASLATLGPGMLLAALNVKYRDFRYVIPFLMQALLFLTPVIYPASLFENKWLRMILELNPVSGAIDIFRSGITGDPLDPELILYSSASVLFFLLAGILYFRKTESYFADLA